MQVGTDEIVLIETAHARWLRKSHSFTGQYARISHIVGPIFLSLSTCGGGVGLVVSNVSPLVGSFMLGASAAAGGAAYYFRRPDYRDPKITKIIVNFIQERSLEDICLAHDNRLFDLNDLEPNGIIPLGTYSHLHYFYKDFKQAYAELKNLEEYKKKQGVVSDDVIVKYVAKQQEVNVLLESWKECQEKNFKEKFDF